jgi:chemotaxis protein methyltransferase CheR
MTETQNITVTEHELSEIRHLIEGRSGILFDESRERFISARVREHMELKKLQRGADLLRLLRSSNVEYDSLLERVLTQETSFFRYPDAFAAFEKKVLPEIRMKKFWENPRSLRVWSAGCATGEEPYSIAVSVLDTLEFAEAWNLHILATDISKDALRQAERGVFPARSVRGVPSRQLDAFFSRVGEQFMVKPKVRNLVTFAPMNLAQAVYVGRFDCIFCMNVLIYFTPERRSALIQRFFDYLEPGGYLFLGHADTVPQLPVKFETIVHGDFRVHQKPSQDRVRKPAPAAAEEKR